MRTLWIAILLGIPLFGQLDSNTITVTAIRAMAVQPDQAAFNASTTVNIDTPIDEVVARLSPAGITAANLTGMSGNLARVTYSFDWLVPTSRIQQTVAALRSLQLDFQIAGSRVSDELLDASRCPAADLLADAAAQARKLVGTTGGTIGPVLTVSNATIAAPAGVARVGQISGAFFVFDPVRSILLPPSTLLNCSLTVKFRLNP
jgi:hypothetical protein